MKNPKKAYRLNKKKLKLHLVPEEAIEGMAKGFMAGEEKGYPTFNYREPGLTVLETTDSLRRHLISFLKGVEIDAETGVNHLDLVLTNAAMLQYIMIHHPQYDNRYKGKHVKVQKVPRKRKASSSRKS